MPKPTNEEKPTLKKHKTHKSEHKKEKSDHVDAKEKKLSSNVDQPELVEKVSDLTVEDHKKPATDDVTADKDNKSDEEKIPKSKSFNHRDFHEKFVKHWFFWWPKTLIVLLSIAGILTISAFWIKQTPEYTYYSFYQAIKSKKFYEVAKYVDFYTVADNVLEDQKVFLTDPSTDFEYARFDIKAKVEYTFLKYIQDGTLESLLPATPDKWQNIYPNKEAKKDGSKKFSIDLKSTDKQGIDGVGGYETLNFEFNGTWKITKLSRNPKLEQDKTQFKNTQNAASSVASSATKK